MKEKRYYCDWILSTSDKKSHRLFLLISLIYFIAVTAISSLINYNIMIHNQGEDLEAYYESAYNGYLDEIDDNVIGKEGIKEAAIPKDVYIKRQKKCLFIMATIYGVLLTVVVSCIAMVVVIPISMVHKKKDMKKIFYKEC